jgi:hypothetical protein
VSREQKLRLKELLEGTAPLPEGVEPDVALLEWLAVALQCSRAGQALYVFTFWKFHRKHPKAIFDAKRKRIVEDRLKAGYTLDRLVLAVRGVQFSPHHMGENDKKQVYDSFEIIFRDGKQVETFEALAAASDEDERRRAAEGALAADRPPVPDSRFSEEELESFAQTAADLLATGYEVAHLRAKFNVGRGLAVAEWTRILERAAAIKAERDSRSLNGNGAAEHPAPIQDRKAAKEVLSSLTDALAMPHAREEDFE